MEVNVTKMNRKNLAEVIYFIRSLFLFLSYQLLAPVAGKNNKFISFRERSPDNHTQFLKLPLVIIMLVCL